jgi:RNA polymerase sigma-70 factor (ECF subfamily)
MKSPTMHSDDTSLIEAFQAGDEFAFVSLYNRYKVPIYAFCLKMLLNQEQARDVMQETFLRVYENRERLMNTGAFRAWVFTIARNQCLNQLRRANTQVSLDSDRSGVENLPQLSLAPDTLLEKSEQVELVNRFLAQLKPDYREVIVLREYQNLSYEEIAAITRSTLSSVKSRLFKARRKLAVFMESVLGNEAQKMRS